ncbi:hypothetical protein LOAG_08913 [Loa loa]|uniref:Uncharacterized protein n=1 Tax=Loa loa TaxID=7209 RepID=A0A1S0TTF0_LOALO|nr:hypothetical protein LOAG_08913 [Loa loa]EFO19579.1 hypothetical protein LOAG_08913 [Loa loa]
MYSILFTYLLSLNNRQQYSFFSLKIFSATYLQFNEGRILISQPLRNLSTKRQSTIIKDSFSNLRSRGEFASELTQQLLYSNSRQKDISGEYCNKYAILI